MNRRTSPEFRIVNGWDRLTYSLKVFLETRSEHANFCCDYPESNILWIKPEYADEVYQNDEFWNALLDERIISRQRFSVRVYCTEDFGGTNIFWSNDNTECGATCNDSKDLIFYGEYITNKEYDSKFATVIEEDFMDGGEIL